MSNALEAHKTARADRRIWQPRTDIYEKTDGIVLLLELPGVSEDSLSIEIDRDRLTVTTVTENAEDQQPARRDFHRSFILSEEIDRDAVVATLEHGLLRLELPKAERAKPRRIEVRAQQS